MHIVDPDLVLVAVDLTGACGKLAAVVHQGGPARQCRSARGVVVRQCVGERRANGVLQLRESDQADKDMGAGRIKESPLSPHNPSMSSTPVYPHGPNRISPGKRQ